MPTAALVAFTTANGLYLRNQEAFHHDATVLIPFLGAFATLAVVGAILVRRRASRPGRLAFWLYQIGAPAALVYAFLRADAPAVGWLLDEWPGVAALIALWLATALYCADNVPTGPAVTLAAFAGVAFVAVELGLFAFRVEPPRVASERPQRLPPADSRRPNLYHLVLDGYDARFFRPTLTPETEAALRGFTWFSEAAALHTATRRSLPTVFLGRDLEPGESDEQAARAAFASEESLLAALAERGYVTLAFVPAVFDLEESYFDRVVHHEESPSREIARLDAATFRQLWVVANVPRFLLRGRFAEEWFSTDEEGRPLALRPGLLSKSAPVTSWYAFRRFLELEPELPASGRYTFLHLLLPHPPYNLDARCRYRGADAPDAFEQQYACATNVASQLADRLRALGRLDDSFVVVHADHGSFRTWTPQGWRTSQQGSLDALLMVKPVGATSRFRTDPRRISLLDVAPALLSGAGASR